MHLQVQEITPLHLCRLRHAATHNKQTRCTFQIKDFFFLFLNKSAQGFYHVNRQGPSALG